MGGHISVSAHPTSLDTTNDSNHAVEDTAKLSTRSDRLETRHQNRRTCSATPFFNVETLPSLNMTMNVPRDVMRKPELCLVCSSRLPQQEDSMYAQNCRAATAVVYYTLRLNLRHVTRAYHGCIAQQFEAVEAIDQKMRQ
jgi:hypothetical protein